MTGDPIDLVAAGEDVEWPDAEVAARLRPQASRIGGRLGELALWLAGATGRIPVAAPKQVRCAVLGPVGDPVSALAVDLGVVVRDLSDHTGSDRDVEAAFADGLALADSEVDAGCDLLVVADPDDSPAAALVVALLTGAEPVALLPRGAAAVDTDTWITAAIALRDGRRQLAGLRSDPSALLTALGVPRFAVTVGLIMRAVARRTPVVLDGTAAVAAALLCRDVQARTSRWWQIADAGADPVLLRAATELGAVPVLDLGTRGGDGTGGLLAVAVLRAAAARTSP